MQEVCPIIFQPLIWQDYQSYEIGSLASAGTPGTVHKRPLAARPEKIAARALATHLIPGCIGRGVRLGSENSSGGAAGAGVWKSVNLETWGPGNPEIWGPENKKQKILKIQIRSAQNVGKV